MIELKIKVKDEEGKKLEKPFCVYEEVTWTDSDPVIQNCLKEVLEEFKGEPYDIQVTAKMILR